MVYGHGPLATQPSDSLVRIQEDLRQKDLLLVIVTCLHRIQVYFCLPNAGSMEVEEEVTEVAVVFMTSMAGRACACD
jgi:hypothetical protein